jgi:hypothetical protein
VIGFSQSFTPIYRDKAFDSFGLTVICTCLPLHCIDSTLISEATCRGKAVADGAVLSVVDESVSVRASANAGRYDMIAPWIGDAVASLLEDARDAKDPSMVVRVAFETCLINCSTHLVHGGNRNKGACHPFLTLVAETGRSF